MKFVWSEKARFLAGAGGTENHTLERGRELIRRGHDVEIIFVCVETYDPGFNDIPFRFIKTVSELELIDDVIVYIARPQAVRTKKPAYTFLHFPISHANQTEFDNFRTALVQTTIMTNSNFARDYWARTLGVDPSKITMVYPFAHPVFGTVTPNRQPNICRVLYPNRISPEKGIFVFLEAATYLMADRQFEFVVLGAGNKTPTGKRIATWLQNLPGITFLPAVTSRQDMAEEYARANIVVVPSRSDNWQEPFGMTSVEGQHSGCRVIASDSGGLKETDCGLLKLVEASNAVALAQAIAETARLPLPSESARAAATAKFNLKSTVDAFLDIVDVQ